MQSLKSLFLILALTSVLVPSSFASTPVEMKRAEVDSFLSLVKLEKTSVRLDGRKGEFRPGPSLLFVGLEPQDFEVDMNIGADIVDLRFNEIRAQGPVVTLEPGRIRIEINFANQDKAIRSVLGAIHFRGVKAVAWLKVSSPYGSSALISYERSELQGELKGTGLLKAKWIIDAIRKTAEKSLKTQLERTLNRPVVQASVEKGLMTWGHFSVSENLSRIIPSSLVISENGITFQAE